MKWFAVGLGFVAAAFTLKRVALGRSFDFERVIDRMPDGSPPKWMFGNISAIRGNTERIIDLLEAEARTTEQARS